MKILLWSYFNVTLLFQMQCEHLCLRQSLLRVQRRSQGHCRFSECFLSTLLSHTHRIIIAWGLFGFNNHAIANYIKITLGEECGESLIVSSMVWLKFHPKIKCQSFTRHRVDLNIRSRKKRINHHKRLVKVSFKVFCRNIFLKSLDNFVWIHWGEKSLLNYLVLFKSKIWFNISKST